MGMYFNTEATTRMMALVNRHFASDASAGGIAYWKKNKSDVNPGANGSMGNSLSDLAIKMHGVVPQPKHRQRWKKWLDFLKNGTGGAQNTLDDSKNDKDPNIASMTGVSGYLQPKKATYTSVDLELRRQLFNALNDPNCIEVTFSAVPAATVAMLPLQIAMMGPVAGEYICAITVTTVAIDDLP